MDYGIHQQAIEELLSLYPSSFVNNARSIIRSRLSWIFGEPTTSMKKILAQDMGFDADYIPGFDDGEKPETTDYPDAEELTDGDINITNYE